MSEIPITRTHGTKGRGESIARLAVFDLAPGSAASAARQSMPSLFAKPGITTTFLAKPAADVGHGFRAVMPQAKQRADSMLASAEFVVRTLGQARPLLLSTLPRAFGKVQNETLLA
jgi:hypothetical protein